MLSLDDGHWRFFMCLGIVEGYVRSTQPRCRLPIEAYLDLLPTVDNHHRRFQMSFIPKLQAPICLRIVASPFGHNDITKQLLTTYFTRSILTPRRSPPNTTPTWRSYSSKMATDNKKTTIAVLSIGDMGGGIARLLVAKGFRVVTDVTGRRLELPLCILLSA